MVNWSDEVSARRGFSLALAITNSDPDHASERVEGLGYARVRVTKTSRMATPALRLELTSSWGLIRWNGSETPSIAVRIEIDPRHRPPHGEEIALPFTVINNGIETIRADLFTETQCLTVEPAHAKATVIRAQVEPPDSAPRRESRGSSLFICYAREDKKWMRLFRKVLQPATTLGLATWSDEAIGSGEGWRQRIQAELERCSSALLLVSASFLESKFIQEVELPYLLDAADTQGTKHFPVPISSCLYAPTPLAALHWASDPRQPLDRLKPADRNREVTRICEDVLRYAKRA